MNPYTSRALLAVMAATGWIVACVFGVFACLVAAERPDHDIPWKMLAAIVLGSMLASLPVGFVSYVTYRGLSGRDEPLSVGGDSGKGVGWRWPVFAVICGLEALVLPLTFVAANADDDTLLVSIPFNLFVVAAALLVACWSRRRRASIVICVTHLMGISVATVVAAIDVETVVASGPLLFISALALACMGPAPRMIRMLFGLSTIAFIIASTLTIAIGQWNPNQAEGPLFAAMVGYQIVSAPVGLWLLYADRREPNVPSRGQYGIGHLIAATAIVCLGSSLGRVAYTVNDDLRIAVAVGLGALVMAGIVATIAGGAWNASRLRSANPGAA